jgi:ankyrin repeat protein
MELLLINGAQVDLQNSEGRSALTFASEPVSTERRKGRES